MKKLFKRVMGAVLSVCIAAASFTTLGVQPVTVQAAMTNLALNKTATASDVESGTSFTADLAVDGNTGTRWATNADNAGTSPKWLQIDFGKSITFDMVDISWEQKNIVQYKLEVSDNASDWTTVFERNSTPATTDESVTLSAPAVGRYLRVYVTRYDKADWKSVSIYEIAVYNSKDEGPVESTGNYTIYPTPQKVTDEEGTITLTDTVNVIKGDGIDAVTKNRIDEVLTDNGLTPSYSDAAAEDKTNLYVGVNNSGDAADTYEGVPKEVFTEGANKYDMHVVKVFADGDIVILGKDSDAAYYGLATLNLMLEQTTDRKMKISTFEDYSFQKYRGCVEGYYGYPWSVEGTMSWFDFAKRYKMNIFLYGPKTDPYHLGQWDEDYPETVTEEEAAIGIRTRGEMQQFAKKAAECNVDFVWVAHPAMKKPIDFSNEQTVDEGVTRLMNKFADMYELGVRQFGIFVDDISSSQAASTCDMQIYMLNQVQNKLYETYNGDGAAEEDKVKPLFFTPAWYTTSTSGASSYMPRFKNVHKDIEICFTGNDVFSSISNSSASTFKNWIGRDPVLWWNYPVNDNVDNVYYTNPINYYYGLDSNPTSLKGVLSNPMNYSESSKVAFFGIADYTWNPRAFNATENWENCFDGIFPDDPEMAHALKVAYGSLNNKYEPSDLTRLYAQYGSGNKTAAASLMDKMYEIVASIEKLETLKNSDDPVDRLLVKEAQPAFNKLYDMAAAIGGAMAVISSDDPLVQTHGYYLAKAAYERLSVYRNPRYQIIALEGSGADIYYSTWQAEPSNGKMKDFVETAMNAIKDFDVASLDTSAASVQKVEIVPSEGVEVRQGTTYQFTANVTADGENLNDVIWSVEDNTGKGTFMSYNGVLTMDTNELSPTVTVKAVSAYDNTVSATVQVKVTDRVYVDPTIPTNQAYGATVLGASGNPGVGGEPENLFDESEDGSKWCPGDNTRYNHWVAFDLGKEKTISTWQLVNAGVEDPLDISSHYSLQVLKDPNATEAQLKDQSYLSNSSNWTIVAEYTNNKENITNYKFEEPITARYFRLYINDGCQPNVMYAATRIYECRLFGVDTATVARTHKLTIASDIANGSITTDASNYEEGAKVNVYVEPAEGYRLKAGSLKYNDTAMEGTSFLMPAEDVVISAEFELDSGVEPTPVDKTALEKAIADAANYSEADYTEASWAVFAEALAKANEVNGNDEATQDDVNAAVKALNDAIAALEKVVVPSVDKTDLAAAIADAAQYEESKYTQDSWAVFAEALAKANDVNGNAEATQDDVNAAVKALKDAIAGLALAEQPEEANKTLLKATYQYAMTLSTEGVTESAKKYFMDAVAAAEAVLNNEKATQEEVNTAWNNLLEGIWALGLTQGDKTMLEQLIIKADSMMENSGKYVETNWDQLVEALEAAKGVYNDGDAMDEDIQPVADDLLKAILAQRFKANKSILEELVAKAEAMDVSGYTTASVSVFKAALYNANMVLADMSLSEEDQDVVDAAVDELNKAIENLSADVDTDSKPTDDNKGDTDTSKPDDTTTSNDKNTSSNNNSSTNKNNSNTQVPATGDNSMTYLWIIVAVLCVAGVVIVVLKKKQNHMA